MGEDPRGRIVASRCSGRGCRRRGARGPRPPSIYDLLLEHPFTAKWPEADRDRLEQIAELTEMTAGQHLMTRGLPAEAFFMIVSGRVAVSRPDLEILDAGTWRVGRGCCPPRRRPSMWWRWNRPRRCNSRPMHSTGSWKTSRSWLSLRPRFALGSGIASEVEPRPGARAGLATDLAGGRRRLAGPRMRWFRRSMANEHG